MGGNNRTLSATINGVKIIHRMGLVKWIFFTWQLTGFLRQVVFLPDIH